MRRVPPLSRYELRKAKYVLHLVPRRSSSVLSCASKRVIYFLVEIDQCNRFGSYARSSKNVFRHPDSQAAEFSSSRHHLRGSVARVIVQFIVLFPTNVKLITNGYPPQSRAVLLSPVSPRTQPELKTSPSFATEFTMSFDDDSRIVIKEGQPRPPSASSRPASSKGDKRKSATKAATPAPRAATPSSRGRNGGEGKPDGFGTVRCVQTFPTGLVVSTGSDGTVSFYRAK